MLAEIKHQVLNVLLHLKDCINHGI